MDELKEKLEEAKQHLIDCVECLSEIEQTLDSSVGGGGQGGDPDDD